MGDKTAHQTVLHLAQIPYYLTFVFLFAWPLILTKQNLSKIVEQFLLKPLWFILIGILLAICLSPRFTYKHPYLLADNRHYIFYLWKKFWSRQDLPWFRFLPIPLYILTLVSMWNLVHFGSFQNFFIYQKEIQKNLENFQKMMYFLLTVLVIVPQPLIEFRYFLIPFIFWRLNCMKLTININHCRRQIALEFLSSIFINLFTFFIFHFKTFQYGDGTLQRIIW